MERDARIFVAGSGGMVGGAIVRRLHADGYTQVLSPGRNELNLVDQAQTFAWFDDQRPDIVFLAAAKVGGILANDTRPGEFIYENLAIETNVVEACRRAGVGKLCFLGSSCIYPKHAPQPMHEDVLLTGPLEPTNQWYAVAKIAGIKLCQAYRRQYGLKAIALMPTNLYGPGDNFDLKTSHVLPALIRKFHEAKVAGRPEVVVWGTGRPRREFLYVEDLADAALFLTARYDAEAIINVGVGEDLTIAELASLVVEVTGYTGNIVYDDSKPDGTPRKLLDVSRIRELGWTASTPLREGLERTYAWYVKQ